MDPTSLRGLSTHDKAPHVMRILQTADLSPRMAASMVEIDRTVSTWPQLGGDVQLGGATVAAAVRRFGRGEALPSGRVRIDLDHALDGLGGGLSDAPGSAIPPMDIDLTEHVPATPLDAIVHAIALAPSGGNSQPWAVDVTAAGIDIRLVPERSSAMDVGFRGSYVAIGAGAFNARVAATRHSMHASITAFPRGAGSDVVVSIDLGGGGDPALADLYPAMIKRITNRNIGRRRELPAELVTILQTAAGAEGWRPGNQRVRMLVQPCHPHLGAGGRVDRVRRRALIAEVRQPSAAARLRTDDDAGADGGVGLERPDRAAGFRIERVDLAVLIADEQAPADNRRLRTRRIRVRIAERPLQRQLRRLLRA